MAVPVLGGTPKCQWVIWSAPNTCPHGSSIYVLRLEYNPVLCSPDLHQISMGNMSSVLVEVAQTKNSTFKRACTHTYIQTHTHTFTQTVHLVLTDPVAHLGLAECEEPPLSQRGAGCCGLGLGCGSQTLLQILSVSLCCPPWLREAGQQSRFLCVFLHLRRQRLPTHISTAAPEGSWLPFHYCKPNSFFWERYVLCACVFIQIDDLWFCKNVL